MLTKNQKYLAMAINPTYNNACTMKEVRQWKKALAGTVHHQRDYYAFVAFDGRGRRKEFEYCHPPTERRRLRCDCNDSYEGARAAANQWSERG
jgi:hypothetical protein